jgi:hypothetical protein
MAFAYLACFAVAIWVRKVESGKPEIACFKGLGEISPEEFQQFIGKEMRTSKVEFAPRAESGLIFDFYMGKNTPERRDYIMDRVVAARSNLGPISVVPSAQFNQDDRVNPFNSCRPLRLPDFALKSVRVVRVVRG